MRVAIALLMLACCASVANAQNTFVSGSLIGEIARFDHVEADPPRVTGPVDMSLDGEVIGFGLSLERALGDRWGVSLEFVKPGKMTRDDTQELPVTIQIFPGIPPVVFERHFEQKRVSWNTMAWLSQEIGDRTDLAFLAGVSFTRTRFTQNYTITLPALSLAPFEFVPFGVPFGVPFDRPPSITSFDLLNTVAPSTTTVEYSVEPIVGMDARFRLTDSLALVPGIRLQSGGIGTRRGWLLRPSVGVRWGF